MTMWNTRRTAAVRGLPEFTFYRTQYVTWASGLVTVHSWVHEPSGVDAGGFPTKVAAVTSARAFQRQWEDEQRALPSTFDDEPSYPETGWTDSTMDNLNTSGYTGIHESA